MRTYQKKKLSIVNYPLSIAIAIKPPKTSA